MASDTGWTRRLAASKWQERVSQSVYKAATPSHRLNPGGVATRPSPPSSQRSRSRKLPGPDQTSYNRASVPLWLRYRTVVSAVQYSTVNRCGLSRHKSNAEEELKPPCDAQRCPPPHPTVGDRTKWPQHTVSLCGCNSVPLDSGSLPGPIPWHSGASPVSRPLEAFMGLPCYCNFV